MPAVIRAIAYHLPARRVTNADLAAEFPEWSVDKIAAKTGIHERPVAAPGECSSDLAEAAAKALFAENQIDPQSIEFVLFCTQTPDFTLPNSACLLQARLGLPTTAGALDFNLGCSGYVYGLSLARGLVESGQVGNVLLLTGDTYSKLLDPADRSVRTIFGDAGTATLLEKRDGVGGIGPVVFGTDGRGGKNFVAPQGGFRGAARESEGHRALWMNGPEIFNFTLSAVPQAVRAVLDRAQLSLEQIDLVVPHQANEYMLETLRKKLGVPSEKFVVELARFGNTVSGTIPIALACAMQQQRLRAGMKVLLIGFGVGYSWGAAIIDWS